MNLTYPEIKPCPFCGYNYPWTFYSVWHASLVCKCGATAGGNNSARVLYKLDEIPEELRDKASPANALILKEADGRELSWPEHGYYSVCALDAFEHAGILQKWNQRAGL